MIGRCALTAAGERGAPQPAGAGGSHRCRRWASPCQPAVHSGNNTNRDTTAAATTETATNCL